MMEIFPLINTDKRGSELRSNALDRLRSRSACQVRWSRLRFSTFTRANSRKKSASLAAQQPPLAVTIIKGILMEKQCAASYIHNRTWVQLFVACTMVVVMIGPIIFLYLIQCEGELGGLIKDHANVFICIPWAAGGAAVVVMLFKFDSSQILFKGLGLEISGAAAPVTMWVICFLTLVSGVAILW